MFLLGRPRLVLALFAGSALVGFAAPGCLQVFGPDLRARGPHEGLDTTGAADAADRCMDCHLSEAEALAQKLEGPTEAPLVADWMVEEPRSCVTCHVVRPHGGRP
ncbi:MAG: hypothetical protein KC457_09225 [Myxococcales bacterium]|nr:hypothetical protein [Myxococcales bacterium]